MRIIDDVKLDYSDVLLRPKRSTLTSRNDVQLERTFQFKNSGQTWTGIPIMAANMDTTGVAEVALVLKQYRMPTCMFKYLPHQQHQTFSICPDLVAVTMGTDKRSQNLANDILFNYSPLFICLDVANGYMESFVDLVRKTREQWKNKIIIAGNVATAEMTEELILAGADLVKVGIGPGSVCTTRKLTGVGYPQLSAIMECADAAHGVDGHIIADGGCVCVGDIAKAFGAGADFVMLGGMFAGHDESGGEPVLDDQNNIIGKPFYGMSSQDAMEMYSGGVAHYRAAEGKTITVPYRGKLRDTVQEILGGVRSCCTYIGAKNIKAIPKCATFIKVNRQLNTVYGD